MMTPGEIRSELEKHASEANLEGMRRFGIDSSKAIGVKIPHIRNLAKKLSKSHVLAEELRKTEVHELIILASMIDDPKQVTDKDADSLVDAFYTWDICDQTCLNLLEKCDCAETKIWKWAESEKEFTRRAAFALTAVAAVHWKKKDDEFFLQYFSLIEKYSCDSRNFVRKSVNWALRQIGKRSPMLKKQALQSCKKLAESENKTARWIAKDAIRELENYSFRQKDL